MINSTESIDGKGAGGKRKIPSGTFFVNNSGVKLFSDNGSSKEERAMNIEVTTVIWVLI